jgi:hypothetical protein
MGNVSDVVQHLKKELERAKREVERYGAAKSSALTEPMSGRLSGKKAI